MADETRSGALRAIPADRMDAILTWMVATLAVVLVAFAAFFVYSVYQVQQADAGTTPYYRSMETARERVRANPNDAALRVQYGITLGLIGEYQEAIEQFETALEIDPGHTGAYLNLGLLAIDQEDYAAAEGYLNEVVNLTEGSEMEQVNVRREKALFFLGRIAYQDARYEDAIGYFKGALRVRRDASDTYYYMALAFLGLEEQDAAIENLKIATEFDPNYAQAHQKLGEIYYDQGDDLNAAVHFRLAANAAPEAEIPQEALASLGFPEEWQGSARQAFEEERLDDALRDALIAANLAPEDLDIVLLLAEIRDARGETDAAIETYRQARALATGEQILEIDQALTALGATTTPTEE